MKKPQSAFDPLPVRGISVEETHEQGQASYRIRTPASTWVYHLEGAGFCSLFDPKGHDWISYRPEGGADGPYRGIPNAVFRGAQAPNCHFHPGHSGTRGSTTAISLEMPDRVVVESTSVGGLWSSRWDIRPDCGIFEITKQPEEDPGYWFLYEGTPGGRFDPSDLCLHADGKMTSLADRWEASMRDVPWVAFIRRGGEHSLLLQAEPGCDELTCYWPLKDAMTVFGFGRELASTRNLLTKPVKILAAVLPTSDREEIAALAPSFAKHLKS